MLVEFVETLLPFAAPNVSDVILLLGQGTFRDLVRQGCINRSILPSGMGARGVSSEHVENMEMFSVSPLRCSPILQLRCALVLGEPCSGSMRTVL